MLRNVLIGVKYLIIELQYLFLNMLTHKKHITGIYNHEKPMFNVIANKLVMAVLTVISFIFYISANLLHSTSISVDPFQEAAKYGFAVLVLFIVLFLLYKEYRDEREGSKKEIKQLNQTILQLSKENLQALERSSRAMERNSDTNQAIIDLIRGIKRD